MILTSKLLDKLLNSDYIKKVYPMIDNIKTRVVWDGDEEYPFYDIMIKIYVNDEDMTTFNMFEKGLDPHYLIDSYMVDLLKFVEVSRRDLNQVYIRVLGPNGESIYGEIETV
jgi:hypothetical protein